MKPTFWPQIKIFIKLV